MTEVSRVPSSSVDLARDASGMTQADIELPRIALLQAQSQVVVDEKAKAGEFWNTLTSETYGNVLGFVPILPFRNRVRLKMGEGLLCRSDSSLQIGVGDPGGECETCTFKDWNGRTPGECGISHNYLVLIVAKGGSVKDRAKGVFVEPTPLAEPEMGVLQFRSMATKAARKLNGLFVQTQMKRPGPWYYTGYRLWSDPTKNDRGNFFVPQLTSVGETPAPQREQAENILRFIAPSALTYVDIHKAEGAETPVNPDEIPF